MAHIVDRQKGGAAAEVERRVPLRHGVRIGFAAVGLGLLVVAALLWQRHGATVFFDLMTAGIATCL